MKKTLYVLLCVLPALGYLGVSLIFNHFVDLGSDNLNILISSLLSIVIAAILYYFVLTKNRPFDFLKRTSLLSYVSSSMIAAGYYVMGFLFMFLIYRIVTSITRLHSAEILAFLGINLRAGKSLWLVTVFTVAMAEEFIFRGLVLHLAQKVTVQFWVANIIQAALFGICHLSVIDGIIFFVLGLILGWIYKKYNCLLPAIIANFAYNTLGVYISGGLRMPMPREWDVFFFAIFVYAVLASLLIAWGRNILLFKDRIKGDGEGAFVENHHSVYKEANTVK